MKKMYLVYNTKHDYILSSGHKSIASAKKSASEFGRFNEPVVIYECCPKEVGKPPSQFAWDNV